MTRRTNKELEIALTRTERKLEDRRRRVKTLSEALDAECQKSYWAQLAIKNTEELLAQIEVLEQSLQNTASDSVARILILEKERDDSRHIAEALRAKASLLDKHLVGMTAKFTALTSERDRFAVLLARWTVAAQEDTL